MIRAQDGDIDFPDRNTKHGIEERREHVWKFLARRVPQTVMADLLGVSRRTIYEDVQWWKRQCQEATQRIQNDPDCAAADIGLTCLRLEGIAQAAMNDYELARTAQLKNLFLNTAIKAEKVGADLKIATAVWPKAGTDVRVHQSMEATFTAKLGTVDENSPLRVLDQADSRRKVLSAAELILKLSAAKHKKEAAGGVVIDAESTREAVG
jgi:hypothetical protein